MKPEERLTVSVANYIRLQYPDVLFCHIANERQTSPQRGAKLKRMGVRPGMPDLMIFKGNNSLNNGLAIELKTGRNKPTKNQVEVLEQLSNEGWATAICYDFDQAQQVIDQYLS